MKYKIVLRNEIEIEVHDGQPLSDILIKLMSYSHIMIGNVIFTTTEISTIREIPITCCDNKDNWERKPASTYVAAHMVCRACGRRVNV